MTHSVSTAQQTEGVQAERWFVHARLDEEVGTMVMAHVPGRDHDIVADCWDGGSVDHDRAALRARLIAAAPELLAELLRMVEHFGAFASDHSPSIRRGT